MPTGYTAGVADGEVTDFRAFALLCARAFGATVTQRDDPLDQSPKLREVSDYTLRSVAERTARLNALHAMDVEQSNDAAALAYGEALKAYDAAVQCEVATRSRYDAMLAAAMAWEPPTPDHVALKDFMVRQLTEGREFDCGYEPTPPERLSGPLWRAKEMAAAVRMLEYALESLEKETTNVERLNAWITALYDALPKAVPA